MAEYEGEMWVEIYQKALLELGHSKMRGRIGEARAAITTRVEKLRAIPGLHDREYLAIDDALNAIRFLEREEVRYDENKRRMALETAARKLESIGPKINDVRDQHEIAQKRYRSGRHDRNFVRPALRQGVPAQAIEDRLLAATQFRRLNPKRRSTSYVHKQCPAMAVLPTVLRS